MAGLSTHVLDTSNGKPAVELKIELYKVIDTKKVLIKKFVDQKHFCPKPFADKQKDQTISLTHPFQRS